MARPVVEEVDFGGSPEELFAAAHERKGSFFLDSGLSAGGLGAWSFIGFDPFLVFRSKGKPLSELKALLERHRSESIEGPPFLGGAVGFLSYELCSQLDRMPRTAPDDPTIPDMEFGFYDGILAFDHAAGKGYAVANPVHEESAPSILRRLKAEVRRCRDCGAHDGLNRRIPRSRSRQTSAPAGRTPPRSAPMEDSDLRSNVTKAEYLRAVARVRDYIAAGDVYQVNLSQRYEAPLRRPAYEIFQRLRKLSPAPFAAYLNCGDLQVASSSPERFLRIRGDRVDTRPIKGTRPRGKTPAEDERLRSELLASAKDRAELLMIVDLERNDLGRVCETGSVRVDELCRLESHPTVHHLVANVSGRLPAGRDAIDCIRAMFPGGSITGAPKIRAMQIIDGLETRRRHLYTGAIGYLGFDGDCDLNIAIRTLCISGGAVSYGVGGGIVWDSDPEAEYQETLDKGRALRAAILDP